MAWFRTRRARTVKARAPSGTFYTFAPDLSTPVSERDATYFRAEDKTYEETDARGEPLVSLSPRARTRKGEFKPASYKKFVPRTARA